MGIQPELPVNRQAIFSLIFSILTFIAFCIGIAPIPLTSLVCYPFAVLLGLASLWMGMTALQRIRQTGERGRVLAITGLWMGGLALLAVLCAVAVMIALFPYLLDFFKQIWMQIQSLLMAG